MTPPSATTSCRWRQANTSWNHGYKGIAENGRAGSHLVPMILQWPLKKKGPKGRRGQESRAHTYPTVSSRPRGRRVQSFVPIGSEMWICIRYKQTNKQTYIQTYLHSSLYIRYCECYTIRVCPNFVQFPAVICTNKTDVVSYDMETNRVWFKNFLW
jgi:hypothetical protein